MSGCWPPDIPCLERRHTIDFLSLFLVVGRWVHFASIAIVFGGSLGALGLGHHTVVPRRERRTLIRNRFAILDTLSSLRFFCWRKSATADVALVRRAAIIASISGFGWLAATIANATGGPASLVDPDLLRLFFLETPFGPPAGARVILLAGLLLLASAPAWTRTRFLTASAVSAALLTSQAWLGHAADGGADLYGAAMIAVYAIHVLAASAWVGGLPILLLVIVATSRDGGSRQSLHDRLVRYSGIALILVGLVVATGAANTVFHLRAVPSASLWRSAYTWILAAKIGLVALMLALAACNRLVVMPRLRGWSESTRWLAASVGLESLVAALVLAAAAVLGMTAPPG